MASRGRSQLMPGNLVTTVDRGGQYRFITKPGTGEATASSDRSESNAGATNGIDSVRRNVAQATVLDEI